MTHKLALNGFGRLGLAAGAEQINAAIEAARVTLDQGDPKAEQLREEYRKSLEQQDERPPVKVYVLRKQYDEMSPELIRNKERDLHCQLIPVEQDELDRLREQAKPYTVPPTMPIMARPTVPPDIFYQPEAYRAGRGHKTPTIPPKDYAKKKKARRKAQKQARRKGRR